MHLSKKKMHNVLRHHFCSLVIIRLVWLYWNCNVLWWFTVDLSKFVEAHVLLYAIYLEREWLNTTIIFLKMARSVLFVIQGNPILSYSSKFSKNSFLYSNQNPIISYSVNPITFYILHTYFLPLLHLTHLYPTTFYILHLTHLYLITFYQKF